MADECFYCYDTGYIHTEDDIPDQMCPNCEIGQAVIRGYNAARKIGIQACDTLEAAKDEQIQELKTENAKLNIILYHRENGLSHPDFNAEIEISKQAERIEELETALQRIDNWAKAYPLKAFPEPDLVEVHEILKAHGLSLDVVSASNMRHVLDGVKDIVEQALKHRS